MYALIIVMFSVTGNFSMTTVQDFSSLQLCNAAAKRMGDAFDGNGTRRPAGICVQTSDTLPPK